MNQTNKSLQFDVTISVSHHVYDEVVLFDSLKLKIPKAAWTCLLGVSGVGKTTLLKVLAELKSENSSFTTECSDGYPIKNRIAYMAQQDMLLPWLNVVENVTLGDRLRGNVDPVRHGAAHELIDQVGLKNYAFALPAKLSGGMRQRVALARTLIEDRPVVLMDEPFSALDAVTRLQLQDLAAILLKDKTVLLVTHDPLEALRLGNHIYLMAGRPAQLEKIAELTDQAPRDIAEPSILANQADLLTRMKTSDKGLW